MIITSYKQLKEKLSEMTSEQLEEKLVIGTSSGFVCGAVLRSNTPEMGPTPVLDTVLPNSSIPIQKGSLEVPV